jgi:hypothetical protein
MLHVKSADKEVVLNRFQYLFAFVFICIKFYRMAALASEIVDVMKIITRT